jgi:hypothetical protein
MTLDELKEIINKVPAEYHDVPIIDRVTGNDVVVTLVVHTWKGRDKDNPEGYECANVAIIMEEEDN